MESDSKWVQRKALLLDVFLHVNRELSPFQKEVIETVMRNLDKPETLSKAVELISRQVDLLSVSGWKPNNTKGDQVMKPDHYDRFPMEPTYFIVTSGGYHWCIENFLKYVTRYPFKNGVEDLKKSMRNLAMYIRHLDGDPSWSR